MLKYLAGWNKSFEKRFNKLFPMYVAGTSDKNTKLESKARVYRVQSKIRFISIQVFTQATGHRGNAWRHDKTLYYLYDNA